MQLATTTQRPHPPPVPPRPSRQVMAEALKRCPRPACPTRQAPPPPNTKPWRSEQKQQQQSQQSQLSYHPPRSKVEEDNLREFPPSGGRTVVYESSKQSCKEGPETDESGGLEESATRPTQATRLSEKDRHANQQNCSQACELSERSGNGSGCGSGDETNFVNAREYEQAQLPSGPLSENLSGVEQFAENNVLEERTELLNQTSCLKNTISPACERPRQRRLPLTGTDASIGNDIDSDADVDTGANADVEANARADSDLNEPHVISNIDECNDGRVTCATARVTVGTSLYDLQSIPNSKKDRGDGITKIFLENSGANCNPSVGWPQERGNSYLPGQQDIVRCSDEGSIGEKSRIAKKNYAMVVVEELERKTGHTEHTGRTVESGNEGKDENAESCIPQDKRNHVTVECISRQISSAYIAEDADFVDGDGAFFHAGSKSYENDRATATADVRCVSIQERIAMSSLQGLPPLPRSLSGFNLNGGRASESVEPPPPPARSSSKTQRVSKCAIQSSPRPSPPARQLTTLDTQLAILRREMFGLRQLDLSLLSQLWSLNESIQEFRQLLQEHEDRVPSPSPSSEEGDDASYGTTHPPSHPQVPTQPPTQPQTQAQSQSQSQPVPQNQPPAPPRRPGIVTHHHRPGRPPRPPRPPPSDDSPSSEEYGAV